MAGAWTAQLRLLLLVSVACGVVQMHVFGHATGDHEGRAGAVPLAAHAMAAPEPVTGGTPEDRRGAPVPDGAPDLLAVCLAILATVGLAAAVALLWLRTAVASFVGTSRHPAGAIWRSRGPPLAVPGLGRRLAFLSVLRI